MFLEKNLTNDFINIFRVFTLKSLTQNFKGILFF